MKKLLVFMVFCMLIPAAGCGGIGNGNDTVPISESAYSAQPENAEAASLQAADAFFVLVQAENEPLANAAVSLLSLSTCESWQGETNAEGLVFPDPQTDRYARLHVEMPGYQSRTELLDMSGSDGPVTLVLEPAAAALWYMAVECVTESDAPDAEHRILLLSSPDGTAWSLAENVPPLSGSAPDIEWDGENLFLLLGNGDSVMGQRHIRIMRYDGSSGIWMGPVAAGVASEGAADYSMGVFDYSALNRDTALFRTADGTIRTVGLGQPNGSFDDLELSNPMDRTEVYDFVCGFSEFLEGYGGSLLCDTRTRYRAVLEDEAELEQPDVLVLPQQTWLFISDSEHVFSAPVSDAEAAEPEILKQLPSIRSEGSFAGVSVMPDPDGPGCVLAFGDQSDGSVALIRLNAPDAVFRPAEAEIRISPEALGLPAGTRLINPGICRTSGDLAAEAQERSPMLEAQLWNRFDQLLREQFSLSDDGGGTGNGIIGSMEDGVLTGARLEVADHAAYCLYYDGAAAENFVLQSFMDPAGLERVGFCFDLRLSGFEQTLLSLTVGSDGWRLTETDFSSLLNAHGNRMHLSAPDTILLAEGACEPLRSPALLTLWSEDGLLRLFSDDALLLETPLPEERLTGGSFGLCLIGGAEAVSYPYQIAKCVYLS
jgi:hypothetical protein